MSKTVWHTLSIETGELITALFITKIALHMRHVDSIQARKSAAVASFFQNQHHIHVSHPNTIANVFFTRDRSIKETNY